MDAMACHGYYATDVPPSSHDDDIAKLSIGRAMITKEFHNVQVEVLSSSKLKYVLLVQGKVGSHSN